MKVYDGTNLSRIRTLTPFGTTYTGGVFVATANGITVRLGRPPQCVTTWRH